MRAHQLALRRTVEHEAPLTLYLTHLPKTGGASLRKAIGCNCAGGVDVKSKETLSGTDDCVKTTQANGVVCFGHRQRPPQADSPTAVVLRNPVTRLESWAAYNDLRIADMLIWAREDKVSDNLYAADDSPLTNVRFLCFENLQEDYAKLRATSDHGIYWSEVLPKIHTREHTARPHLKATPDEREEIARIFDDDMHLWKNHCAT